MKERIRLGFLGCGAITQLAHLPAALGHPGVVVAALVDSNIKRAQALKRSFGLDCRISEKASDVWGGIDAVINALPNHLHAPLTLEALGAGAHVLCEKPLAVRASEARVCCEAADQRGLVLAAGMNRHFDDCQVLLNRILEEGLLGSLQDYDWEYGSAWEWKPASNFYLSRAESGGGDLINYGVHLLDSLFDWFGPARDGQCQHDDWGGGIEANVILNLVHSGRFGEVPGRVRLSRTYNLRNRLLIRGTAAQAELPVADRNVVILRRSLAGRQVSATFRLDDGADSAAHDSFWRQIDDFVCSVLEHRKPLNDGWQAVRILEFIERCYAEARRIPEPWSEVAALPAEIGT
jgi:predicted dehydrogenase